jgi:hypothetical protein
MKKILILLVLFSFNLQATEYKYTTSKFDKLHASNRIKGFSELMSHARFKKYIKSLKEESKYIMYVEVDDKGYRRVLISNRSKGLKRTIKTGRTYKDFKEQNTLALLKDRKLLSLHVTNINDIDIYSGVWVNYRNYHKEVKKLKNKYGISPPTDY